MFINLRDVQCSDKTTVQWHNYSAVHITALLGEPPQWRCSNESWDRKWPCPVLGLSHLAASDTNSSCGFHCFPRCKYVNKYTSGNMYTSRNMFLWKPHLLSTYQPLWSLANQSLASRNIFWLYLQWKYIADIPRQNCVWTEKCNKDSKEPRNLYVCTI